MEAENVVRWVDRRDWPTGRVFRKQLLRYGKWEHPAAPGGVLNVTRDLLERIAENFRRRVVDTVAVPLGHDVDGVTSIGEVVHVEVDDDGLWGVHVIERPEDAERIGRTWKGSSALVHLDWKDRETGERVGPVLLHNAVTNLPVVNRLAPFEAVALGESTANNIRVISLDGFDTEESADMPEMTAEEMLDRLAELSDEDPAEAAR